ncbi:MAG: type II secretion system F family protein [bacterium]|nr:type II secretion system F family protein [bacterium]
MLFNYQATDQNGTPQTGAIEALSSESAVSSLQRRGLTVGALTEAGSERTLLGKRLAFFDRVKTRDVVLLSRELATLFLAQVSALRVFRLMSGEVDSPPLREALTAIADDVQGGSAISRALSRHPHIFSNFYVSMVRAGEEAGKLSESFEFLADHLERTYEVTSKAKNALIYPIFVIVTFFAVMILMLTTVIPQLSHVIAESGREVPFYTRVVVAMSDFFVAYGVVLLALAVAGVFALWQYIKTPSGRMAADRFVLAIPKFGMLLRKLYLSRVADNMHTMLSAAIPIVRAIEITRDVVGSPVYGAALDDIAESVKGGRLISDSLGAHREFPGIMVAMVKVGEEAGELGNILETLSRFYRREVTAAVDTLVGLIEPILIVGLGLGVGVLLAAVLIPIYSISASI